MAEMILVKVAPLGNAVVEVLIPLNSTVADAISAAIRAGAKIDRYDGLTKNGKSVTVRDTVLNGDIIVLTPSIKGGI